MGILFNSTALGIHFCETSLIFNFKTRLGGEICLCDVNMHKGYCLRALLYLRTNFPVVPRASSAAPKNRKMLFFVCLFGFWFG